MRGFPKTLAKCATWPCDLAHSRLGFAHSCAV